MHKGDKQGKRILLLITNLSFGGAQQVFRQQSLMLAKDHDVVECVFNLDAGYAFPSGNELVSLDVPAGRNFFDKLLRFRQRVVRLRKLKRERNIQICISHLEGADLVNILSRHNDKAVCWIHGSKRSDANISGLIGWFRHKFLIPFVCRSADRLVAVSRMIALELERNYGARHGATTTINNYIDLDTISGMKAEEPPVEFGEVTAGNTLVTAGRLAAQKNFKNLLLCFRKVLDTRSCKLVIIGDGELRGELLAYAESLRLRAYHPWGSMHLDTNYDLYFLGYLQNPFMYMRKCTLFVLSSMWEGFPMVLGEALACGLPIVAADCPTGPREILGLENTDETSVSIPTDAPFGVLMPLLDNSSAMQWAATLIGILDDESRLSQFSSRAMMRASSYSKTAYEQALSSIVAQV